MKFPEIDKAHFQAAVEPAASETLGGVSEREAAKDALIENLTKQVDALQREVDEQDRVLAQAETPADQKSSE